MKGTEHYDVKGETLVVYLPEELDHHAVERVREKTDRFFLERRIRDVVFDYGNTSFMDSSGIGLVMGRYREIRYLKGDIFITGVHDKIARILEISGLYRVAKRADGIEEALRLIDEKYKN